MIFAMTISRQDITLLHRGVISINLIFYLKYCNVDYNLWDFTSYIVLYQLLEQENDIKQDMTILKALKEVAKNNDAGENKQKIYVNGFNSIFAVSSIEMAKMYYQAFKNIPNNNLKIALIYSYGVNEEVTDYFDEENDESLYLPWYYTDNNEKFSEVLYDYKNPKTIYCHTDLSTWDVGRITALKNIKIYSGHIHFGWENEEYNLYNLTAAMAFNFNDINQDRFIYIIENGEITEKIKNVTTPQFKRLYNEQIFNELTDEYFNNSFVQLMINKQNINKANYIERIKELKHNYSEKYSLSIKIYDNVYEFEKMEFSPIQTNISEYIHNNVPNHLENKFNLVKNLLIKTDSEEI